MLSHAEVDLNPSLVMTTDEFEINKSDAGVKFRWEKLNFLAS